jgi:hypothetical protein
MDAASVVVAVGAKGGEELDESPPPPHANRKNAAKREGIKSRALRPIFILSSLRPQPGFRINPEDRLASPG